MRIDLTTLLNGRCDKIDFNYSFDINDTEGAVMLPDEFDIPEPALVVGCVTDKNGCMFLNAKITVKYRVPCNRCLEDIAGTLEFDFERMISTEDGKSETDEFDVDDAVEEILYVKESGIDPDISIVEDIALELPVYNLCKEDCLGLCPKCGKNLNDGNCGCSEKKEIDPRLKKLQKLLDNFE